VPEGVPPSARARDPLGGSGWLGAGPRQPKVSGGLKRLSIVLVLTLDRKPLIKESDVKRLDLPFG
jgi:hypothetical protein